MKNVILSLEEQNRLQENGVEAVILFGSQATNTATDTSDYDFGILLSEKGRSMRQKNYHEY